jgi:hypothetical protein
MTSEAADQLERAVMAILPRDRRPTEEEVGQRMQQMRIAFDVTDEEFDDVRRRLHAKLAISMDLGVGLVSKDHVPWLAQRRAEIEPFYWDRYRQLLLQQGRAPDVINTVDTVGDTILDFCGDPMLDSSWTRRGLVVGDVQSGKTGMYTGLICKAADAGYRLIILLTGTLESLRRQTQERLDEGFVGLDSAEKLQQAHISTNRAVGVGILDQSRYAGVFTSKSRDFNHGFMNQLGVTLGMFNEPVLLVVKKNKRILENLENWLRSYNAGQDGTIRAPLLLIDDEADSASINTAPEDRDPTAINAAVRALLHLFRQSTYVGFTATPFANVFVNPDSDDDMVGDDLFPRDFVYTLDAPTNYFGPEVVFNDQGGPTRAIEDAEAFFPVGHKRDLQLDSLPESMVESLRSFIIASTIRDLRGDGGHRSMLVNVSRFTAVQDRVAVLLDAELKDLQRDIRSFSQLDPDEALMARGLHALHDTWQREFSGAGFAWSEVQRALRSAALPIEVRAINQRTGAASLDYRQYEQGLRVVAVGGNSLSRGLTLEGLTTSYFFRNSQMYDTLLQMGRWFGYRDGYDDLCRVWITDEAFAWYTHISVATEELRQEIKRMQRLGLTPRDFGLKVRAHPDSLIVTARNKMRSARSVVREVSLNMASVETTVIPDAPDVAKANFALAEAFVEEVISASGPPDKSEPHFSTWDGVPKALIADFLRRFETHPFNYRFQSDEIAAFLASTGIVSLTDWTVAIPNGSANVVDFGGVDVRPAKRTSEYHRETRSVRISGKSARVASRGDERAGVPKDVVAAIGARYADGNVPDLEYRQQRKRPLLLVHAIQPQLKSKGGVPPSNSLHDKLVAALTLSFPRFDDTKVGSKVEYKVNLVEWRSIWDYEAGDDVTDTEDA